MIYRLIVLNGPSKGQRITVDPDPMIIGRDAQCEIPLPDEEMAIHHAQLEHRGHELFIHDLGSMNKIILNKHEVQESRLKHGDIIELGRTRLLVQAIVQAEVQSAPDDAPMPWSRGRKRKMAMAASLLLLAGGTFAIIQTSLFYQGDMEHEPEKPLIIGPEPAPPMAAISGPSVAIEAPPSLPPAPEIKPIDDELRKIREDLSSLQKHLQKINVSAPPLADGGAPVKSKPKADTKSAANLAPVNDIESIMTAVRGAIAAEDYDQADTLLEHLQMEYPDYLPAYRTRAELFEKRDNPAKAREQWTAILQRTTESELYRKAVAERIRLGRTESQHLINALDAVRIQALDQIRFRESAEYDEMRTIKIQLSYDRSLGPIDPKGVRLLVYFFEQNLDTQRIALSPIQPFAEANLSILQQDTRNTFSFSVSYVAPKGYYTRDPEAGRQRYFGFVARLHYFDQLVDEQARPAKLLEPAILEAAGLARVATARGNLDPATLPLSN